MKILKKSDAACKSLCKLLKLRWKKSVYRTVFSGKNEIKELNNRYLRFISLCMITISLSAFQSAWARPKIGLVLSGGGARGAAHVGVIQVLEEMNIPVDFVVGTSMGSIIGGLYAIGTPPPEIEELTTKLDWDAIFSDSIPRRNQFFRDKSGRENYLFSLNIDSKKGLSVPEGLLSGVMLDLTLRSLTLGAGNDFNDLPIPYRAVATDLENGEMVVLGEGDFAKSLRASMSIPAAFAPVEINGRKLVDGGIARNLPIDVARKMGADIIIAVDIGTPLSKMEDLNNFLAVTNQTTGFMTVSNTLEQIATLKKGDILIRPDLRDVTTGSFKKMKDAVSYGREAALKSSAELKRYSLSDKDYKAFKEKQMKASRRPEKIDFIRYKDEDILNAGDASKYLKETIEDVKGRRVESDVIASSIFEMYKRGNLKNIDFRLVDEDGKHGLLLEQTEKENIEHKIDVGVQLTNDFDGNATYDLLLDYTMMRINSLGAQWENKLSTGERRLLSTEFYQPLNTSPWKIFMAPYAQYQSDPLYIYDGREKLAEYKVDTYYAGFDLGYQLAEYGELRAGVIGGKTEINLQVGDPGYRSPEFTNAGYKINFTIDRLDNPGLPHKGTFFESTFIAGREHLGSDENFDTIKLKLIQPFSIGRSSIILRGRAESLLTESENYNQQFFLGGFLNLSGLAPNQLYGQQLALGEFIYTFRLLKEKVLGNDLYGGFSAEAGNVWQEKDEVDEEDLRYAGSIFIFADTVIGPVYLSYGHCDGGFDAAYFYVGSLF